MAKLTYKDKKEIIRLYDEEHYGAYRSAKNVINLIKREGATHKKRAKNE